MTEKVSFHPTKRLFIDVLTRDISIRDCILDLLDNSVDSYTRHGIQEPRDVSLIFNEDCFEIKDTCGGVSKDDLKNEVFRFGMSDFTSHTNTIGVYGIGLKRSIFKLGTFVCFETDDGDDYCKLEIDVNSWLENEELWELDLTETRNSNLNGNKPYTKIKITNLRDEAKDQFRTSSFENEIKTTISFYYSLFISDDKIKFETNNESISGYDIKIRGSEDYKPVKYDDIYDGVSIQIICWLHISEEGKKVPPSGWNVYMNNRLVLLDDTTSDTGWKGEKPYLPQYHSIHNQFRGIVFLKTDEPYKLPINTSKNGFNKDSRIYQYLLSKMCEVSRPFINFLSDKYDKPKTQMDETEDNLFQTISQDSEAQKQSIKESTLADASYETTFTPPPVTTVAKKADTSIQYQKAKDRVALVKKVLNVKANYEVGSETFEYFWDGEGLDEHK